MANLLTRLFDKLTGRKEDTRPDPEDSKAYAHADKVEAEQDKRAFPLQTLKNGSRPSDVSDSAKWEAPDPGYTSWVDVYESPRGIGYVINYEFDKGGKTYRKCINYGPEEFRDQDWEPVPPPPATLGIGEK